MSDIPAEILYPALASILFAGLGIVLLFRDRTQLALLMFTAAALGPRLMEFGMIAKALSLIGPR